MVFFRVRTALQLLLLIALLAPAVWAQDVRTGADPRLSTGGQLARQRIDQIRNGLSIESGGCANEPDCDETPLTASSIQSETTIAVDGTGQHVVVGFNDFRGFL